ncbi:hypothetical protein B0H14DRAFT_2854291 [Mycena olivaceomarginata]|nr:hypothetical protein B0H14DRAFT_2854291 [Mycena olivaceomarginata]
MHTIVSLNADDLEDYEDLFTLPSQSFLDNYWLCKGPKIIVSPVPDDRGHIQVFIDPTSQSADGVGTTFLDVGTRKMRVKDDVPKKMAGSTLHQPGRTKPLASSASSTTATFAPYVNTEGETMRPPPFIPDTITCAHSKSSSPAVRPLPNSSPSGTSSTTLLL